MTAARLVLGADAGGTKTVAWLANVQPGGDFEVLGRGAAGPGNPSCVGHKAALENVAFAIRTAGLDAGLPISHATQAVIGMAGAGSAEVQYEMARRLRRHTEVSRVSVIPDVELILPAAFSDREGIAVISGTGSIVLGAHGEHRTRVGGWGYLVGDDGSGYWFGRELIRAIARAADGRGSRTVMSDLICERTGTSNVSEIIASLYDAPSHVPLVTQAAKIVFDAAVIGDPVANQIIVHGAHALAEMIVNAASQVGYAQNEVSLAVAGGVLLGAPVYQERLLAALSERSMNPVQLANVRDPVLGALRLASFTDRSWQT